LAGNLIANFTMNTHSFTEIKGKTKQFPIPKYPCDNYMTCGH
jgi:hypothetical protein